MRAWPLCVDRDGCLCGVIVPLKKPSTILWNCNGHLRWLTGRLRPDLFHPLQHGSQGRCKTTCSLIIFCASVIHIRPMSVGFKDFDENAERERLRK